MKYEILEKQTELLQQKNYQIVLSDMEIYQKTFKNF